MQNDWHEPSAVIIVVTFHQKIKKRKVNASLKPTGGPQYLIYCPTSFHLKTVSFAVQICGRHGSGNTNGINAFQIGWNPLIQVLSWEYFFCFGVSSRFDWSQHYKDSLVQGISLYPGGPQVLPSMFHWYHVDCWFRCFGLHLSPSVWFYNI